MKKRVQSLLNRISLKCLSTNFLPIVEYDKKGGDRVYIQIVYSSFCSTSNAYKEWSGRKYYLSEHMTDDEIIKTTYVAFEQVIKHEIMEGFKVDGKILFNPHVNFEELLKISNREVTRKDLDEFAKYDNRR